MHHQITDRCEEKEGDVTPFGIYKNRRQILKSMGIVLGAGLAFKPISALAIPQGEKLEFRQSSYKVKDDLTPIDAVTGYNNYYEFGTKKSDPARYGGRLKTEPWTVKVEGEIENPGTYSFEDLVPLGALEERIYRLRCVEAWSMIIPWLGVPLNTFVKKMEPTSRAKYIQFETLADRKQMRGLRVPVLDWPYVEGLRMDEAMHPLTLFTVGLYGQTLLPQNGAPLRLVVPWKYGFKSIKSIVAIRFVEKQPETSWFKAGPREYGFYSNVNPQVNHPRWSQATERRIGEFRRRKSLMFNGYAEQVASLYQGMDLRKFF
jgi:sulfoxide reductase catalytic subunit YedY